MQELVGKGYEGIKHMQQWDKTMPKKKELFASPNGESKSS